MRRAGSSEWTIVESALYRAEDELQRLLADSPSLLPLADMRPEARELLVAVREFQIPGSGYLDLLGFSAEGDIVLMECKLRANPQIKREVVGQLFEYAGFLWEMTYENLDNRIRTARGGKALAELMSEAVEDKEWDAEHFRQTVAQRLQSGGFILVIVVDRVTDELERAAAFLNACARANFSFHVVEMERFQAEEAEILIPHVHGAVVRPASAAVERGVWPKERFLEAIQREAPEAAALAEDLYEWSEATADRVRPGRGTEIGSFSFHYVSAGRAIPVFAVYTDGRLELHFDSLYRKASPELTQAFYDELHRIPGFSAIQPDFRRWPAVQLQEALGDSNSLTRFKEAVGRIRQALR